MERQKDNLRLGFFPFLLFLFYFRLVFFRPDATAAQGIFDDKRFVDRMKEISSFL